MKKLVNGKVVDIKNIKLFELAAEGAAIRKVTTSMTNDGIITNINSPLVSDYIKKYDIFYKSMPYPLYDVEDDIKYATLGNFIQAFSKTRVKMWVNHGLFIRLDDATGMTLHFVNGTWAIVYVKDIINDNTSLDLFKNSVGYEEYSWVLNKIIHKEKTNDFYNEFMRDFISACNNQSMVIKWELENILTFSTIPKQYQFEANKIINTNDDIEYTLDIFCSGFRGISQPTKSFTLSGEMMSISSIQKKQIKTYNYDLYSKSINSDSASLKKLDKKPAGINTFFNQLCAIKNSKEISQFPDFTGIIVGSNLIYIIESRLYITKVNREIDQTEIAHGARLYSIDENKVYFIKSRPIADGISSETLYSYNITDGIVRVCKIIFST